MTSIGIVLEDHSSLLSADGDGTSAARKFIVEWTGHGRPIAPAGNLFVNFRDPTPGRERDGASRLCG